jgi:tetratricopeptide (TPR) repeat protein
MALVPLEARIIPKLAARDRRDGIACIAAGAHNHDMYGVIRCAFAVLICTAAFDAAVADQNDPRLDPLFKTLQSVKSPEGAHEIEAAIWHIWSQAGTAGGGVLFRQGLEYMNNGEHEKALTNFNALVEIEPDFAEGWNKRATLYYMMGNLDASVADIQKTLSLEERHFGALSGLGLIYSDLGQKEAALKAFRAALDINPHMEEIRRRADELAEEVEGLPL